MANQSSSLSHSSGLKTTFYPCCNRDVEEPCRILAREVRASCFATSIHRWNSIGESPELNVAADFPLSEFIVDDAFAALFGSISSTCCFIAETAAAKAVAGYSSLAMSSYGRCSNTLRRREAS